MNRRSFFRTLGLGAAAAAAQIYLPKFPDSMRWKVTREASGIYVPNPEWVNAPYEVLFLVLVDPASPGFDVTKVHPIVFKRGCFRSDEWPGFKVVDERFPIRFKALGGPPVPVMKKLESFA